MESIVATANIQGKQYRLVPKTIKVQNDINELVLLSNDIVTGKSEDYAGLVSKQIDFLNAVAGCHAFDGIPLDSIDLDDITIACTAVVNGYKEKVQKANAERIIGKLASYTPKQAAGNNSKGKKKKKK